MKCPFLENHVCIRADGQYRLCCISLEPSNTETIHTHSPKQWLESPGVIEARNTLDQNRWPQACKKCELAENAGQQSKRQSWQPTTDTIEYLDLRFGNQCNLQCQMCFPGSSTSLVQEHKQLLNRRKDSPWGTESWQNHNWFDLDTVKRLLSDCQPTEVYLTGGEPFMVKGLLSFLQLLDSSVHVRFNTNATIYNTKLFHELRRFNIVTITASIDGYGKVNDYIRWPSDWDTVEYNVYKFAEFAFVNISPTIQVLNSLYYPDLKNWVRSNGFDLYLNPLHYPYYHNIKHTPDAVKHLLHSDIKAYSNGQTDPKEIAKFCYYTKILDSNRGVDIIDYLPELANLYNIND